MRRPTICLDLLNTVIVKKEYADKDQVSMNQMDKKTLKMNYIIIEKEQSDNQEEEKCQCSGICICNKIVYSIKPYAIDFIRTISTFFELIGFAKLPDYEFMHIIQHLENLLNEDLIEQAAKQGKGRDQPFIKTHFHHHIYEEEKFIYVQKFDSWIPNLIMLKSNRKNSMTYLASNNIINLVTALHLGFCMLPVVNSVNSESFELHLLEMYIIKIRTHKMCAKMYNIHDFKFAQLNPNSFKFYQELCAKHEENEEDKGQNELRRNLGSGE